LIIDRTFYWAQLAHFGRPAQPYSAQALEWLKENVEGRYIKCQLLRRDQYQRIVALPLLPRRHWRWRWWWWLARVHTTRNLSLEMVRAGWGVVYEKTGAEYGQWNKEAYLVAQSEAQCVFFFSHFFSFVLESLIGLGAGLRGEAFGKVA
jgi:endonuclease YncB( thermonuclease family)